VRSDEGIVDPSFCRSSTPSSATCWMTSSTSFRKSRFILGSSPQREEESARTLDDAGVLYDHRSFLLSLTSGKSRGRSVVPRLWPQTDHFSESESRHLRSNAMRSTSPPHPLFFRLDLHC
jgi:hypothetical protein